jgi:hypothetical protein
MPRLLVLLATIACVSPAAASDQPRVRLASLTCPSAAAPCATTAPRRDVRRDRIMLAQRRFDCFDRCFAEFKTCLGEPTRTDPPQTLKPPGSDNTVPTPPPFEFCIRVKQECEAICVGIDPPPARR